jgi:hypothetical protein
MKIGMSPHPAVHCSRRSLTVYGSPQEVAVNEPLFTGLVRLLLFQPGVPQRVVVFEQVIEPLPRPEKFKCICAPA